LLKSIFCIIFQNVINCSCSDQHTKYLHQNKMLRFFFAPSKVYFPSSKQEMKFMICYMQHHLHCHFHSYYSHKILFRIKTVHILLYTHYSYLTAGFLNMTGHKLDEVTWLKVTCCLGSINCNLAMDLSWARNNLQYPCYCSGNTLSFF